MLLRLLPLCGTLVVVLASCASSGRSVATPPATLVEQGAAIPQPFPHSVAEFVRVKSERYDDPNAGVRVGYETPGGLWADVFLYPIPAGAGDSSMTTRSAVARAEVTDAAAMLHAMEERGGYSDVALAAPTVLEVSGPSGRVLPIAYVAASMRLDGRPVLSDVYVLVLGDRFLKVRATYPAGASGGSARAEVRIFVAGIAVGIDDASARH